MKIDDNYLLMKDNKFNLNEIAMIAVQQMTSYEEFGFENNYWIEFKLTNGDNCDIETSRTQEEGVIVRRFKVLHKLFLDKQLDNFINLGHMLVNLEHAKDVQLINKNKGVQILFNDFHIDYPELGKWRAKRTVKRFKQKVNEYANLQAVYQ